MYAPPTPAPPYEVPLQKLFPEILPRNLFFSPPGTLFKEAGPENRIEIASELPEIQSNMYAPPKAPPPMRYPTKIFPRDIPRNLFFSPPGTLFKEAGPENRIEIASELPEIQSNMYAPPKAPPPYEVPLQKFFPEIFHGTFSSRPQEHSSRKLALKTASKSLQNCLRSSPICMLPPRPPPPMRYPYKNFSPRYSTEPFLLAPRNTLQGSWP